MMNSRLRFRGASESVLEDCILRTFVDWSSSADYLVLLGESFLGRFERFCAKCGKSPLSRGAHAPVTRHLKPPYLLFMAETGFPHSEVKRMKSSETHVEACKLSKTSGVGLTPIISPDLQSGELSLGFTCDADAYRRLYY
jgi:hypothetical protein